MTRQSGKPINLYYLYLAAALATFFTAGFAAGSLVTNLSRDQADQVYYQRIYGGDYGG